MQFWSRLSSHLRFWVSINLLSSQMLISRLPENPVTLPSPPVIGRKGHFYIIHLIRLNLIHSCFEVTLHVWSYRKTAAPNASYRDGAWSNDSFIQGVIYPMSMCLHDSQYSVNHLIFLKTQVWCIWTMIAGCCFCYWNSGLIFVF